jgi:hypothetical protein
MEGERGEARGEKESRNLRRKEQLDHRFYERLGTTFLVHLLLRGPIYLGLFDLYMSRER